MELKSFGGAYVVYAWLKGALPHVGEKLINVFGSDDQAMLLVTSYSYTKEKLKKNKIALGDHIKAHFSGTVMVLFVYHKREIKEPNKVKKHKVGKNKNEKESIQEAFKAYNRYHLLSKDKKTVENIEMITQVPKYLESK